MDAETLQAGREQVSADSHLRSIDEALGYP